MLNKKQISAVLKILKQTYGTTTTALKFNDPFQLLISTILSAQSTDKQVNKITTRLYKEYPDAHSFIKLSEGELEEKIRSIGLYRSKAHNILETCKILVEKYQGMVPSSREDLIRLPGVGRKTANVVLSVGFRHDAIAVDTHVFRVSNRIGLADSPSVKKTEEQLMETIPRKDWSAAHHWLIWHGRQICKAQKPLCSKCPLTSYCEYYKNLKITDF
jgi:endonuclease-3